MSIYEPNPAVRPTEADGGEFIEQDPEFGVDEDGEERDVDPTARPSGSPPARSD